MKNIITSRKVAKEVNVEFKGVFKGNLFDKIVMYLFGIPKDFTVTREELVRVITNGVDYHTQNADGSLTKIEVVNYKKKYLRSVSNNGSTDNLDSLPIYE